MEHVLYGNVRPQRLTLNYTQVVLKRVLFSTCTPLLERWTSQRQIGSGPRSIVLAEDGIVRNGRELTCETSNNGQKATKSKPVPHKLRVEGKVLESVYLPDVRRVMAGIAKTFNW